MTWRLRVRHRTGYSYAGDVVSSYNEARMTPLSDATQTTLDSRVDISPPASSFRYRDYWGTHVTSFDIHAPHNELVVTATSVVETHLRPASPGGLDWDDLGNDVVKDRYAEWLSFTGRTDPDGELADLARASASNRTPNEAAIACVLAVREHMDYRFGATAVHTSGLQAWQERKGVCQDFAHVSLAMMRSLGIPSRYVSGYLHPKSSAGVGEVVAGESHAWVEWWDGGWNGFDPTNSIEIGSRHVTIGRGRDYGDVPPFKGLFSGAKSGGHTVRVAVTRLA